MGIAERKRKWIDFLSGGARGLTVALVDAAPERPLGPRPHPYPDRIAERIDFAARHYEDRMERTAWLTDDAVPAYHPYTGTELFAEAFGCPVHYPGDNMPFARPLIFGADGLRSLKAPDTGAKPLRDAFEITYQLRRRCGPDAVPALPDIQSPFDIAALVWEKADFLASMIEAPEAVAELCAMAEALLAKFLREWFAEFGTEYVAHYPDYYMSGGMTLSEDEIGEFSGEMFARFCRDPLNRLSREFGGIGIHCCAHARHQWANLKGVEGLQLINLVQPPKVLIDAYRQFEGVAQMHSWCGDGEPSEAWLTHLPSGANVVLRVGAKDREGALRALDALRDLEARRLDPVL